MAGEWLIARRVNDTYTAILRDFESMGEAMAVARDEKSDLEPGQYRIILDKCGVNRITESKTRCERID